MSHRSPDEFDSREGAAEYLEQLQLRAAEASGVDPVELVFGQGHDDPRAAEAAFQRSRPRDSRAETRRFKRLAGKVPSIGPAARFEHPYWVSTLQGRVDQVDQAAATIGTRVTPVPIAGTVRSMGIQAVAQHVPFTDESLIIFPRGLFVFGLLMAKVFAMCMPRIDTADGNATISGEVGRIDYRIFSQPMIVDRAWEALSAYIETGHPAKAPAYHIEPRHRALTGTYGIGLEVFAVGHEYTHLNDPVAASAEVVDSNDPDLALWALELNADVKGMQFAAYVSQHNGHDVPTSLTGPYVFLTAVDLLQKGISVIQTGGVRDHISRTHPPAWLRRDLLTQTIRQSADDVDDDILWHAEAIAHAGERLWTELAERFRAARSRGVRPAIEQRDAI